MFRKIFSRNILSSLVFFGLAAWLFGGDIWGFFSDRSENTRFRAQVCERMVVLGYIRPDTEDMCLNWESVYFDGLAAAASSQTSRIQAKVKAEIDQIYAVTAGIDATQFTPITMDSFLELYRNSRFPKQQVIRSEPEQMVLEAPWVMITGFGGIRVERPMQIEEHSSSDGVGLSLNSNLAFLRGGMLDKICRRTFAVSLGCSGSVFIVVTDGLLEPNYTVVGMQLTPIPPEHLFWAGLEMLMPPFADGNIRLQSFYMQRFLNAFPDDTDTPSTLEPNARIEDETD